MTSYILSMLIVFLVSPWAVLAVDNHDMSVEEVVLEIREAQDVSVDSQIVCDKVSDEQFVELGEAVMSLMHPDERVHELMDQMMGGEGSESLRAAHIMMGAQYLGCAAEGSGLGMMGGMGMMGGGMMNSMIPKVGSSLNSSALAGERGEYSMMGFPLMGFGSGGLASGWLMMILFLTLIILGIVWLIKNLSGKNSNYEDEKRSKALAILKERYAKGEIDRKEFKEKKQDIS